MCTVLLLSGDIIKFKPLKYVLFMLYRAYIIVVITREREVYDSLIRVVGCEMDIRIRHNMFLIKDKIYNKVNTEKTQVSIGSLADGLDLQEEIWKSTGGFIYSRK